MKTKKNELKVFHNVCKHRAGPLVYNGETQTCNDYLSCKYHKWCYNPQGQLVSTPGFGDPDLEKSKYSLDKCQFEEVCGLIFVRLDNNSKKTNSVVSAYGDLFPEKLKHLDLSKFVVTEKRSHKLKCNWKTYVENYLEGYHIPAVHPSLHANFDSSTYKAVAHSNYVEHLVEKRALDSASAYTGQWFWLYPNVALNIYQNAINLEYMVPIDERNMEIRYTYLTSTEANEQDKISMLEWSDEVTNEDVKICESVQRNLESGIYTQGKLSPIHENGVSLFQNLWREHMGQDYFD